MKLCHLDDIPNPGAKGFDNADKPFFIVRHGDTVRAYSNSCPHTSAPLNWQPDQFLDIDEQVIQCSLHMALFDIPSGQCIAGPCINQHLKSIPIVVDNKIIYSKEQK